ncbi:MAG: ATP-dependent DNA helicase RecG [Bacteroidetes bacterium]|nr:ATP-dependent DNA helicase RecG [Bacteroidota bacterium]
MNSRLSEISIQYGKGIGPKRGAALISSEINTIDDLLNYFPFDYLDRSRITKISDISQFVGKGIEVTVIGKIFRQEIKRTRNGRTFFLLTIQDETGFLTCMFFAGHQWYKKMFPIGKVVAASSYPEFDQFNRPIFVHPEFDRLSSFESVDDEDTTNWEELINTGSIVPKYHSSEKLRNVGLDSRGFRKIIHSALNKYSSNIVENLPEEICKKRNLINLRDSINQIHFPHSNESKLAAEKRLKYEELFYFQLMILMRKELRKKECNAVACVDGLNSHQKFILSLPFKLTDSQKKCISEILLDLKNKHPMNRLLQGDVGSGKTVVAICAAIYAIANNVQCAILVPTEILAEQHFQTLTKYLNQFKIKIELLIGKQKKKLRTQILNELISGDINIIVGTHALLEEEVKFNKLGLIIIDEQHRFGVAQRSILRTKSLIHPHVLVMTATPIPRTLAMTLYGDLDVSVLTELPAKRKKIITGIRSPDEKIKIYSFIKDEILKGRQIYIVYPLIEESEKIDLKAAITEYESLSKNIFKEFKVGLIHGRLSSQEKEIVMSKFKTGEIKILVTTTVIEVGIDVPNATVMLIEHAERFGLSQLHQLRGRVGRGTEQSYTILLADFKNIENQIRTSSKYNIPNLEINKAKKRLQTLVNSTDGFEISQIDLEIRGQGDYFGYRQSGMPLFKIANIIYDEELLLEAKHDAEEFILKNSKLDDPKLIEMKIHFEKNFRKLLPLGKVG